MSDRFETQDRLIAATRTVMVTLGIEGCTLERICSEAGFSRGAFYSNFASKEELFALVAQDEYDTMIRRLNRVAGRWEEKIKKDKALGNFRHIENYEEAIGELLEQVLSELKLDRNFFIIHNEMLVRAVRVPEWAHEFREINNEFVRSTAEVFVQILRLVGRKIPGNYLAIAQASIGIVLRATGYEAWEKSANEAEQNNTTQNNTAQDKPQNLSEPILSSNEINQSIVALLIASSVRDPHEK